MTETKDKVVTIESLSALHDYNKNNYVSLTNNQTISGVKTFSDNLTARNIDTNGYVHLASVEATTSDASDVATIASEDTLMQYAYDSAIVGSYASTIKGTSTTERIGNSIALGGSGLDVNSNNQVVMGKYNVSDSNDTYSLIVGNGTLSTKSNAFALDWEGNGVYSGGLTIENYLSMDRYADTTIGDYSVALGHGIEASGIYSTAFGLWASATGYASFACGDTTTASNSSSFACGRYTTASGTQSFACGYATSASGERSFACGNHTIAEGDNTFVCGKYNQTEDAAFVIGNGTSSSTNSDALTIDWNGNANFAGSIKSGGTAVSLSGHTHSYLYNSTADKHIRFFKDGNYCYFRPDNDGTSFAVCGSSTNPWYKTWTERLEVIESRIVCQPTYDNTVTYATNMFCGTTGVYSRTTNTSSKTIKHDIQELQKDNELSADNLYDVGVYQFKYNDGVITDKNDCRYNKDLVGFIIEDLDEKYPIAVDKPSDDVKEWSWNAQYLIPSMLKLIQDQKKMLDKQQEEINTLKEKIGI